MKGQVTQRIQPLREAWEDLERNGCSYIFQTVEWVDHWLNTVGKAQGIDPFLFSVDFENKNSPMLILPLGIRTFGGIRILTHLGGFHADYSGVVMAKGCGLGGKELWNLVLAEARMRQIDGIWVRNIPSELPCSTNPLYLPSCRKMEEAHSITLDGSWEEFISTRIKTRVKADSRRQKKRLSELGTLRFNVAESRDEAVFWTETMIAQKRIRYAFLGIRDQFENPENSDFYLRSLMERSTHPPHVSALTLDDKILAVHWGEVYSGRFYYLMPSHDPHWERYSPGRLLLEHLIEWSFKEQLDVFDFTSGAETYKFDWTDKGISLYEFKVPLTGKGWAFLNIGGFYRDRLRPMLQQVRKKALRWTL